MRCADIGLTSADSVIRVPKASQGPPKESCRDRESPLFTRRINNKCGNKASVIM